MMKKIAVVLLSTVMLLCGLCSCSHASSHGSEIYKNPAKIETNYNNVTNYPNIWLTSDSICYEDGPVFMMYVIIYNNSKTKTIDGHGIIQKYGNKVYMMNESYWITESQMLYKLNVYDVETKKRKRICTVRNCDNFLVLNDVVYYLEYSLTDDEKLKLKKVPVSSGEISTVAAEVLSFGVIENELVYVTEDNGRIVIYQYNDDAGSSVQWGEFSVAPGSFHRIEGNLRVSYTADCVLFSWVDEESVNEASVILKYSVKDNTLHTVNVDGYIEEFVAYDNYSYFVITSHRNFDDSELFRFDNETNEISHMASFAGYGSLFVGSDEGAYILEQASGAVRYYSEGKTRRRFINTPHCGSNGCNNLRPTSLTNRFVGHDQKN